MVDGGGWELRELTCYGSSCTLRGEDHHRVANGCGEVQESVHGLGNEVAGVVDLRGDDGLDVDICVRVVDGGISRSIDG